jgi:hypothetical protein
LKLTATDGSAIASYAIAGSVSVASGSLGSAFSGSGAGSGTVNMINRPLDARIGDPYSSSFGSGVLNVNDATILASRSDQSRIVADAAGAAILVASSSKGKALGASIAGGYSYNEISGGVTAGIYSITDFTATGYVSIIAEARRGRTSSITSFSGGFAASVASSSASNAGALALGWVVAKNKINDPLKALIKNVKGGANNTIRLGNLAILANNERRINAVAAGGGLTLASGRSSSGAIAIGSVDGANTIDGGINAGIDIGSSQLVTSGNGVDLDGINTSLDVFATDTSQIQVFSLAAAISMASGSNSLSLSGGGAGAINSISSNLQASISAAALKATGSGRQRVRATTTTGNSNSKGTSRKIKAEVGAGSAAVSASNSGSSVAAAIGVTAASNKINWDSTNGRSAGTGVSAKLDVGTVDVVGGLDLSTINADSIDATVASVTMGLSTSTDGNAIMLAGAGAGATNSIGTKSSAQIVGSSNANNSLSAGSLQLTSLDIASIKSAVGAGSFSASFAGSGGLSVAPSIGIAIANNTLSSPNLVSIEGYSNISTTSGI